MSESYVQVPTDGKGKKLRTIERMVAGNDVHEEAVVNIDPTTGNPVWVDYDKIADNIKKSLDLHSTFQWEHFLEQGVDAHFIGRVEDLSENNILVKVSDYWKQVNYNSPFEGTLTLPKDKAAVAIYSYRAFEYPQMMAWVKLPSLSLIGNETSMLYYLGLENGSAYYNGLVCFRLSSTATVSNSLDVIAGPAPGSNLAKVNINSALPTDFNTAYHVYRIVLAKNMVFYFIDTRLRAVIIQALEGSSKVIKNNVLPYGIGLCPPLPSRITSLIELLPYNRTQVASSDFSVPLAPFRFRVSDGKDIIPLSLPLYLEDNDITLAGYQVASGSVTSHPFPLFGYNRKTLLFQADQSGTIVLQVLTNAGNWRTYNSDPTSASTLYKYIMTGEAVLGRIVFTPNSYPCNINDAEVNLS